jgi:hypothetical protein
MDTINNRMGIPYLTTAGSYWNRVIHSGAHEKLKVAYHHSDRNAPGACQAYFLLKGLSPTLDLQGELAFLGRMSGDEGCSIY